MKSHLYVLIVSHSMALLCVRFPYLAAVIVTNSTSGKLMEENWTVEKFLEKGELEGGGVLWV